MPDNEKPSSWILSPEGDKIVYETGAENTTNTYLLFPASGQKHKLDNCSSFTWLDNTHLQCPKNLIVVTSDYALIRVPLKEITPSRADLDRLLSKAGKSNKFEATTK